MTGVEVILVAAIAFLGFAFSALFSGLETGLYTLNRIRLDVRADQGEPSAIALRNHLRQPVRTLVVLLLGTNAASYVATYGLASLLHATGLSDWTLVVLEAALLTPLLFVFAETVPKDLFRTHTDRWMYGLAPIIGVARHVFTWTGLLPFVEVVTTLVSRLFHAPEREAVTARERISLLVREGVGAGVLSASQATLTDRALAMRDRRVDRVMNRWRRVVSVPIDASAAQRERSFRQRAFSRLPVVDRGGAVVGILSWIESTLDRDRPMAELMTPHLTLSPDTPVLDALATMRAERQAMAVVAEPHSGRALGLVTLKDLVEPLTGRLAAW